MSSRRRTPDDHRRRLLPAGSQVEVRSNDIGLRGAWPEATIVKNIAGQRSSIISCSTLVAVEASLKPLEEKTLRAMIRPRPPPANPAADFEPHQCVEAFHNGVWWKGVVTKVPERGGDLLYSVCFPARREEFQLKASEVRRQMKWVKGEWINVEDGDLVSEINYFSS